MPPAQLSNFLATGQLSELLKTIHKYFKSDSPSVEQARSQVKLSESILVSPISHAPQNILADEILKKQHELNALQSHKPSENPNAQLLHEPSTGSFQERFESNKTEEAQKRRNKIKTMEGQLKTLENEADVMKRNEGFKSMRMILDKDKTPLTKNNIYDPTVSGNYVLLQNLNFGEHHTLVRVRNGLISRSQYARKIDIFIKQFFYCLSIIKTNQLKASLNFKHIYIDQFRENTTIVYQNNKHIVFLKGDDQLFFTIQNKNTTLKCPTDKEFKECAENFITKIRPCYGIYQDADDTTMKNTVATLKGNLLGYASAS